MEKHSTITAQAILEYFLIFSIVIALTLVSVSSFVPSVRNILQGPGGFVEKATRRLGAVGEPVPPVMPYDGMRQSCMSNCPTQQPFNMYCNSACGEFYTMFTGGCIDRCIVFNSSTGGCSTHCNENQDCLERCLLLWATANDCVTSCSIGRLSDWEECRDNCADKADDW